MTETVVLIFKLGVLSTLLSFPSNFKHKLNHLNLRLRCRWALRAKQGSGTIIIHMRTLLICVLIRRVKGGRDARYHGHFKARK